MLNDSWPVRESAFLRTERQLTSSELPGTRKFSEQCDGPALNGTTCGGLGFHPGAGALRCNVACQLDTSGCFAPSNSLMAHWALDEAPAATSFEDRSGNGHIANCSGLTCPESTFTDGAHFDGVSDFIDLGIFSLSSNLSSTVSLWFKLEQGRSVNLDATGTFQLFSGGYESGYPQIEIKGGYLNGIDCSFYDQSARGAFLTTYDVYLNHVATIQDGQWHQVACVIDANRDSSSTRFGIFLDGVAIGGTTVEGKLPRGGNIDLHLGNNPTYGKHFPGAIRDVRLYSRPLSASEVRAIFDSERQAP